MKKIRTILIGTHNDGKFKELSYLLPKKLKKLSPKQLRIKSPKETGKSFLANSKLKSNYFYNRTGIISISDDSGLCIKSLGNKTTVFPGILAKVLHYSLHGLLSRRLKVTIYNLAFKFLVKT